MVIVVIRCLYSAQLINGILMVNTKEILFRYNLLCYVSFLPCCPKLICYIFWSTVTVSDTE